MSAASGQATDGEIRRAGDGWVMLGDPELVPDLSPDRFDPDWWSRQGLAAGSASGRGAVWFVKAGDQHWALRHYRRGGLVGRLIHDHYLFTGEEQVRSIAEWRITAQLHDAGLPVPRPVAAAYRRSGLWYRADLITVQIPQSTTLTECLAIGQLTNEQWQQVGVLIRRFHDADLNHADLNAHNILFDASGAGWLIDFDRARLQQPGAWSEGNLSRLKRSLHKVTGVERTGEVDAAWHEVLAGYSR